MNVSVADSQGILSKFQESHLEDQLFFALLKFGDQIDHAKALVALDRSSQKVYCGIDVRLQSGKFISVTTSKDSLDEAMNAAVEAIESKVAFRVDWNAWVNSEKLSTWLATQQRSLNRMLQLMNSSSTAEDRRSQIPS